MVYISGTFHLKTSSRGTSSIHAIIRWEGLLRYQHVSEECIGHVVLLRCRASDVCPAFSDTSKLNESVAWRLCSPINPFHHCLVNSISFSCLIKKAFTQITEILLLTCVIAYESGGARFCEVNRTDTLVLVLILVQIDVLRLLSLSLLHVHVHVLWLSTHVCVSEEGSWTTTFLFFWTPLSPTSSGLHSLFGYNVAIMECWTSTGS